jgi:hypothetical protein
MDSGISLPLKLSLLWRIWTTAARVRLALWRGPLPEVVSALGEFSNADPLPVALLSRAIFRGLRVGPWQPRCLIRSLVLYRLLRGQGDRAVLVIGLHEGARTADAHAWVELAGRDVGPPPGGAGYRELSRYPRNL